MECYYVIFGEVLCVASEFIVRFFDFQILKHVNSDIINLKHYPFERSYPTIAKETISMGSNGTSCRRLVLNRAVRVA